MERELSLSLSLSLTKLYYFLSLYNRWKFCEREYTYICIYTVTSTHKRTTFVFSKRKCIRLGQWRIQIARRKPSRTVSNMADDESSSTSDESLDVKSVKFDPMKALYSRKIDLSSTRAPIYDNVSKFEAVMSGLSGQMKVRIALARADSTHTHKHTIS